MKFDKIVIPENITKEKGINEIKLDEKSLGNVVAFVGKNGAGKSRILEFIQNYWSHISAEHFLKDFVIDVPNKAPHHKSLIEQAKGSYKIFLQREIAHNTDEKTSHYKNAIGLINNILPEYRLGLFADYIKVVNFDDIKRIKQKLSNNLSFQDILNNNFKNDQKGGVPFNEFNELNSLSIFDFIKTHSDKIVTEEVNLYLRNKNSPEFQNNPQIIYNNLSKTDSFILFEKFRKYVIKFLGKDFSYEADSNVNISSVLLFDGINFRVENLSPGQKTLFAYAILFFYLELNSRSNITECIVIIDEPELHLHPQAQVELLDALKSLISKGQIFIATHSTHILSHLSYDEIYMVKNGQIILPSRTTPGNSLIELMGIERHIEELEEFITSTSSWAYSNFMTQCFKDPDVIFSKNQKDPQYKLFKNYINSLSNINLLDFGAGKGRVGYTIDDDAQLKERIVYNALEPNESHHDVLRNINCLESLYSDINDIKNKQFDIILLCNVLHEIHPQYWIQILKGIKQLLRENGKLVIIEDNHLPKGECAHEFGYLLLNADQIATLLDSGKNLLSVQPEDDWYKRRFTFCVAEKNNINPTTLSLSNALNHLKEETYESLKEIRKKQVDVANGRLYANLAQLYINAELALEKYDKKL